MSSKLGIANHALRLMGEEEITDFDGEPGETIAAVWEDVVEDLLTDHRWRFAVKKVALSEASGSPVNEWTKHFDLPDGFLMVIRTYPASRYEIYEDKLLTNNTSVSIDYIFDPGVKEYPTYFALLLGYRIANETCLGITQNASLAEQIMYKYNQQLAKAEYKDSQGRTPTAIVHRPYIDIRG